MLSSKVTYLYLKYTALLNYLCLKHTALLINAAEPLDPTVASTSISALDLYYSH